jgi:8-oxo-dGDP phosphatase
VSTQPVFRHLGEQEVHRGKVWRVVVADYEAPTGEQFQRDVVRSPGAVGVVPVVFDVEGNPSVVLVRQYRPVLDRWLLEVPAGMRDVDDEPPELTARRELREEAGFEASDLVWLTAYHSSAGMTDNVTEVYLATGLHLVERQAHGPEEEHLEVVQVPLRDAIALVERGEITDAKTVIGLLLTERRLSSTDGRATAT